jgi:hypothetical protein
MTLRLRSAVVAAAAGLTLLAGSVLAQQQPTGADHEQHHPAGTAAPAPAPSPAGMPGMGAAPGGMLGMMGQMMPLMSPTRVEGRLAFLKAELKITDAQASQWNAFADALRTNAKAHADMHSSMMKPGQQPTLPDKLAMHEKMMTEHVAALSRAQGAGPALCRAEPGPEEDGRRASLADDADVTAQECSIWKAERLRARGGARPSAS